MNMLNKEPERFDIEALLPWHAAGTLSRRDADRVEQALASDRELQRRYAMVREEFAETIHLNESLGAPSSRAMEKLFAAIDAEEARAPRRRVSLDLGTRITEGAREDNRQFVNPRCTFPVIAEQWESHLIEFFETRYRSNRIGVMRRFLHDDNHIHAKLVAHDVMPIQGWDLEDPQEDEYEECQLAAILCERVIAQKEQTAEHYAQYAIPDPFLEGERDARVQTVADHMVDFLNTEHIEDPIVWDLACGNGSFALLLLSKHPTVKVFGFDYSQGVLDIARRAARKTGWLDQRVWFRKGQWDKDHFAIPFADTPHAIFCGEFLEHVESPHLLIDQIDRLLAPNGLAMFTTPCGPFAELLSRDIPRQRGHVHAFSQQDIAHLCEHKRDFHWNYLPIGHSPRGSACGYWIGAFRKSEEATVSKAQPIQYWPRILTERPYQALHVMMIVKDAEEWLPRCLGQLYGIADKIVIGDTGSKDHPRLCQIAKEYHAEVHDLEWRDSFADARNQVMAIAEPGASWLLWIDADETLSGGVHLHRYLNGGGPFNAYAIEQVHLTLDQPVHADRPCRVFRAGRGTQFAGAVHEQPTDIVGDDLDRGVLPALVLPDVKIAHLGYLTRDIRVGKMMARNLDLLRKESEATPRRILSQVHIIRDLVTLAIEAPELMSKMQLYKALAIYDAEKFDDPESPFHSVVWPYYQDALRLLGIGYDIRLGLGGAAGQFKGKITGERIRVRTTNEAKRLFDARAKKLITDLEGPAVRLYPATPKELGAIHTEIAEPHAERGFPETRWETLRQLAVDLGAKVEREIIGSSTPSELGRSAFIPYSQAKARIKANEPTASSFVDEGDRLESEYDALEEAAERARERLHAYQAKHLPPVTREDLEALRQSSQAITDDYTESREPESIPEFDE